MSGLLSLEQLWQGEARERLGDGLHFCRMFSGGFHLCLFCGAGRDQLAGSPGSQGDRLHLAQKCPGCFWHCATSCPHKSQGSGRTNAVWPVLPTEVCKGLIDEASLAAQVSSRHFSWD